jgi:hypothetical protein
MERGREKRDDDDDEYKPVWPSGLWVTSQAGKTYSHKSHAPFTEAFWLSREEKE